ncbi:MAG TPA: PilC/PilY family type IV pilus protein [Myxococcota bacterium]|nr:PilC/PilY family type IV pilus protein [Myxococcota bacterium]
MTRSLLSRVVSVLCIAGSLAFARDARAQAGDLDILSRTVPPIVIIQFDSSGSMKNIILPDQYLSDRGAGNPSVWFNVSNNATSFPASLISTTWKSSSTSENFQPTCQLFGSTGATAKTSSLCYPSTNHSGCLDDDQDDSEPQGGQATLRCWNMPGGCANAPAGWACSTTTRARSKASSGSTTQNYTVLTAPNVSATISGTTYTTDYPQNYMWWVAQQIYLGKTPVPFIGQDRNIAGKQAITNLVNAINIDGQPPRVKFGLARYSSTNNGGYITVPADLNNKAAILSNLALIPPSGGTPLSETLVDVARYLAGADKLGSYPQYNRDPNGVTNAALTPPTPVTSSCEKLFVIAITDGLPTSDNNDHYGSAFTNTFGAYNNGDGSYLDDVAKKLYATDLRTTLSGNQNVITYTVGFTVNSTLLQNAANGGHGLYFNSNNAVSLANSLTSAITDIIARNTSLTSATVPATRNAFGNGFYTAYFIPSGRKSVWPGKLEAYTLSPELVVLDDNNNPAIDPVTNLFIEPRHPHWEAGAQLISNYMSRTLYTTKNGARISFSAANTVDPNGATATQLTTTMLNLGAADTSLYPVVSTDPAITDPNAPAGTYKQLGKSIVSWVQGVDVFDENADGSRTDARSFVFGDVFHSSPVSVGPPLTGLRYETGYGPATTASTFMAKYAHRDRVLYVGANDGFLHGFDAGSFVDPNPATTGDEYYSSGTGKEVFGYVPGLLLPKIKNLPRNDIAKSYFVDGEPSAADAWIDYNNDNVKDGTDWTTVLITPMRQGGEGLLALDITDPSATSGNHGPYPRLMWEFTNAGLGQTWSRPIITRVRIKAATGTGDHCGVGYDCIEQWVAIFGAGYEDVGNPNMGVYVSDPNAANFAQGKGVFMVRLKDGSVLAQLKPAATGTFANMKYAMPAEPAVLDLDNDGFADVVYIGDTGGQMWKWDISAVGVLTGGVVPTTVWPAGIIFQAPVATVASGVKHYHSIFEGAAAADVMMMGQDVLTLSFASGERADLGFVGAPDPADPNNPMGLYDDNNRFWVIQDKTPTGSGAFPSTLPIYETAVTGHQSLTDITNTSQDNDPNDSGYFFKVPDGEKFITNHIIFGGVVLTLDYLPDIAGSGASNDCALGGTTFEYSWTLANGVGVLTGSNGSGGSGGSGGGSGGSGATPTRSQPLGNGAPTNPRITISRGDNGEVVLNATAQTSSGEVAKLSGLPTFDPVKMVFWRQDF